MPNAQNKWLFSATMPEGIRQIIKKHLSPKAHYIEISKRDKVNKNIDHQFLICEEMDKFHVLLQMINSERKNRGIIFCRTKTAAQTLAKQLIAKNISADAIHGDLKSYNFV